MERFSETLLDRHIREQCRPAILRSLLVGLLRLTASTTNVENFALW